jgi:hypothetical protein
MFDWQTIAVILILLAASFYVGRRAIERLRSLGSNDKSIKPSCATGCGDGCRENEKAITNTAQTFVQIGRLEPGSRRESNR